MLKKIALFICALFISTNSYGETPTTMTIEPIDYSDKKIGTYVYDVAAQKVPCNLFYVTYTVQGECISIKREDQDIWTSTQDSIQGFTFVPGYTQKLLVSKYERHKDTTPADMSSTYLKLEQVYEKSVSQEIIEKVQNRKNTLFISGFTTACYIRNVETQCLQVKNSENDAWRPLKRKIRGFNYKAGNNIELFEDYHLLTAKKMHHWDNGL